MAFSIFPLNIGSDRLRMRKTYALLASAVLLTAILFPAQAKLLDRVIVGNQSRTIKKALSEGKSVLIAEAKVFNQIADFEQSHSPLGGDYRPPLTYWVNRHTKAPLVLGGRDEKEGRGKVLTNEYFFYIVEPGLYDFAGYVRKTARIDASQLRRAGKGAANSGLGFVSYSTSTLPSLYSYTAWVPPSAIGSTYNGHTITHWYQPGYYEDRLGTVATDAILVDMRGIPPLDSVGKPNLASLLVEPGTISVVTDFDIDFTHGACDEPAQNHWVCALESITLAVPLAPQESAVQKQMTALKYKSDITDRIVTAFMVPGQYFSGLKPRLAEGKRTVAGEPYMQYRVTNSLWTRRK
jgi:hypothetical protein